MRIIKKNTYNNFFIWIRYYFLRLIPKFFYPLVSEFFFYRKYKKKINLKNPETFTDKLNWLKLYDVTPQKTILTNKLTAKSRIKQCFPDLKYAKVFQVCKSFDEIDFSKCPKSFIIKTNHACKTGIYVEDKNKLTPRKLKEYRKYYNKVLKINYAFWGVLELQYLNIEPHIYIEEMLMPHNTEYDIREYEVYCLNGEPEYIEYTCRYANNKKIVLGLNKNFHISEYNLFYHPPYLNTNIEINVINKENILKYARLLSSEFKFVRVDFFEVDNIIYFGEMTFTPHAGILEFDPPQYDKILGDKLNIK